MRTTTRWHATQTIGRVKELWAEFDYAQRRLLELRMGVPMLPPERPKIAASIDELEDLYAVEDPRLP
jgi:hypothetical protein